MSLFFDDTPGDCLGQHASNLTQLASGVEKESLDLNCFPCLFSFLFIRQPTPCIDFLSYTIPAVFKRCSEAQITITNTNTTNLYNPASTAPPEKQTNDSADSTNSSTYPPTMQIVHPNSVTKGYEASKIAFISQIA